MTTTTQDLTVSHVLRASRAALWQCWADPNLLAQWWAPKPVVTELKTYEFQPGGAFHSIMTLPDGTVHDCGEGCFLELVPESRIVFTDALGGGYRPKETVFMTAVVTMSDHEDGTLYTATAMHKNEADRQNHESMGFRDGWGQAIAQLDALALALGSPQ